MTLRWILLFFAAVACVQAYPYGAPSSICGRVVPGHRNMGTPVMNGPMAGPFMLTATPEGNGIFKVTLRSTTAVPFKGFLIQAVQSWKQLPDEAGDVVGIFQQDFTGRTQLRRCNTPSGSNAITHTFNDTKTMIEASWQAPMNLRDPSVRFVATVVRDYDNFYVVRSAPVMVSEDFATQSTRVTVPGNTGQPFNNNFQNVQPTNPSFPPLSPVINATGVADGLIGGGLSVISNEKLLGASRQTNTPNFSFTVSVTDAPPPPIILPDGRISSHSSNIGSVGLSSKTVSSLSQTPVSGLLGSSQLMANRFNQTLIPVPSFDPLSKTGPSGTSLATFNSSFNSNRNSEAIQFRNGTRTSPILSSNRVALIQLSGSSVTPIPTVSQTLSPSFTTANLRTFGSAPRTVPPTRSVLDTSNRTPSVRLITSSLSSRSPPTIANQQPASSGTSNTSPDSSASSFLSSSRNEIETILIPVDTQSDQSLFKPLNFADMRAPSPTVSDTVVGVPVSLPRNSSFQSNTVNLPSQSNSSEPIVQIINLRIAPEGQRAAVIDVIESGQPEPRRAIAGLTSPGRIRTARFLRPNRPNGAISGQGQGPSGQLRPGIPGFPGNQFGNRFGLQTPIRQPRFGTPGTRGPFGQQPRFGPGQGQMFDFPGGRPGQFGGRGGIFNQQPPRLNGINLPLGGTQFQGQPGTTDTRLGQGRGQFNGQGGQQFGSQTDPSRTAGDQVSSSNLFGGQFGTPVGQPGRGTFGPFGQTRPFGPGFRDVDNPFQPFAPPGFPTGGRIQFSGFGQRPQPGQFGAFGPRQFGGRGPFASQGQLRGQSQFGTQTNVRPDQFGLNRFGSPSFNGGIGQGPTGTQFGRTPFGPIQGPGSVPGVSPSNQLNTFANVPPQGGQGSGTGTFNFNEQTSTGLSGQSSGNLFNQLSQPSDNTVNNLGTGNAQNSAQLPANDQTQTVGSSGDLSNFSFGPFTPNTK